MDRAQVFSEAVVKSTFRLADVQEPKSRTPDAVMRLEEVSMSIDVQDQAPSVISAEIHLLCMTWHCVHRGIFPVL